jgi:polygalacturonase
MCHWRSFNSIGKVLYWRIMLRQIVLLVVISLPLRGALAADVNPAQPSIPDHQFDLANFGGVGDGKTPNTDALTKAVAAVAAAGGGHLNIAKGVYLTFPFALTSHMDLHLEADAVIQFPNNVAAYGLVSAPTTQQISDLKDKIPALVGGTDLTDVSITGSGAIDGGGAGWWALSPRDRAGSAHTAYGNSRPKLVVFTNCQRLLIQGVTLRNSPMYELVPKLCKDVTIDGVHIAASAHGPNTDAIDPMACDNVLISDCDLDVGDDDVAIKAIEGPCTNILVENCRCLHGHGISIGSETYKGIHDVTVRDCSFDGAANGIRIKSARDRGNDLYNFTFSNITMKNVGIAITLNMYYMDKIGGRDRAIRPVTASTPRLHGVHIENVTVTNAQTAGDIIGLPESDIKDVTFSNVTITAAKGMVVRDAQGIVFDHVTIKAATGDAITTEFAGLRLNN